MRLFSSLIVVMSFCFVAPAQADTDDETLKFFLSKSGLVVMGKFTHEPMGIVDESGVINYSCELQVNDVLKGDAALKNQTIKLEIIRSELVPQDNHPLIKKDGECILFLKKAPPPNNPSWVSADFWFGVQHPSPTMTTALKRLAADITFGSSLERIIQTKEPTWKLLNKTPTKSGYIYEWKFEKQQLVAEVSIEASEKAASEKLEKLAMSVPVGPKELKDFGAAAYLWKSFNSNNCMIMLSQSNVFIHVNGTSLDSATRLAALLVDQVKNK